MTGFVHMLSLVIGVTLFQRAALSDLVATVSGVGLAGVPVCAGISELAGQAFVLVSRRVALAQALASFALTALVHVCAVVIWTAAAVLILHTRAAHIAPMAVFAIVAACYAPRILSVLTIAPYYGELLGRALDAWTLACVGWGLFSVAGASLPAAMLCALAGWTTSFGVRHFGGPLSAPTLSRLGLVIAGNAP